MRLRRMMLRRKADPETGKHTLCEPVRHAHGHFTRAIMSAKLQGKWPGTAPGTSFCTSLRRRNVHGHFTRAFFAWNCTRKMPDAPATTSIKHRAEPPTLRNPQWPQCLGKQSSS